MVTNLAESCFHCGEPIPMSRQTDTEIAFCCNGCDWAYQLIDGADLTDYYQLNQRPGATIADDLDQGKYDFLDNKAVYASYILFDKGGEVKTQLHLPQIHCSSCIWLLENLHKVHPAISHSRVQFASKSIFITFEKEKLGFKELCELLANLGYAPSFQLKENAAEKTKKNRNPLYLKLGLAGFCFGNAMLMSFPEYLGISGDFTTEFRFLFRWANAVMSIPVLLYSASDYLQNALTALKTKVLNLDVPIVLGMLSLFIRSIYEVTAGIGAGYFDSLIGFVFFLLLGKVAQEKTYAHLSFERDFKSFFPLAVSIIRKNVRESILVKDLKKGDRLEMKNGQVVPCDAYLCSGDATFDYSFVTGESRPVAEPKGALIYAGAKLVGLSSQLDVVKKVEESYLTELWKVYKPKPDSEVTKLTNTLAKYFTYTILLMAALTFTYWLSIDLEKAFLSFTSVLIVACPCALALATPFTYGAASSHLAKKGFFLKGSYLLEKLGKLNHLVFDKTGTLTTKTGAKVSYEGAILSTYEKSQVSSMLGQSVHPVSRDIGTFLATEKSELKITDFSETEGQGLSGLVAGDLIQVGNHRFFNGKYDSIEKDGTILCINGQYKGIYSMGYAYRSGMEKVIRQLSGFKLSLLSGDKSKERSYLQPIFSEGVLLFKHSPHEKAAYIERVKNQGETVAMIGDGLNDSAALLHADVGISITDDLNNFTPASDVIVKGNSFELLPAIFAYVRRCNRLIYAAIVLSLLYNLTGLYFAMSGQLTPVVSAILMPLSSISVVLFTTIGCYLFANKIRIK